MADDITYTASSPAGVPDTTKQATDEHATRGHMPIVKLALSADGSATHATVDADGVLVNLGANNDVSVTGTVTAELSATDNTVLDNIDAETSLIVASVQLLDDAVYTDGTGTPSAGLAVMGTDGTNPQIISTNTTGHVNIADGGNAITVDGTVTANLSATDNAVLDAIEVDTTTIAGAVSGTEMQVDVVAALPAGTNNIGDIDVLSIFPGTSALQLGKAEDAAHASADVGISVLGVRRDTAASGADTDGDYATLNLDATGRLWAHDPVAEALLTTIDADTGGILTAVQTLDNAISGSEMQVDVVAALPAGTNLLGAVNVKPATSGGLTIFRSIDLDESEEEIKASAGQLFGWYIFNAAATTHYVKFYNATAASVTVGTTTPVLTIPVPAGAAANVEFTNGIAFGTAITAAATTGIADADTGAPAANAVTLNAFYS